MKIIDYYRNGLSAEYKEKVQYVFNGVMAAIPDTIEDAIKYKLQIGNYLYCFHETESIFFHVPKAAGSSLSRSIYGRNVGHERALRTMRINPVLFNKYFTFTVVRNPWDRLVSAYHFVKQGGGDIKLTTRAEYNSDCFSSFERFVEEYIVPSDLSSLDFVFQPQTSFICEGDTVLVKYVGKIEELRDVENVLSEHFGRSIEFPHMNKSLRGDYRQYYNEKLIDLVLNKYKVDVDVLSYQFE